MTRKGEHSIQKIGIDLKAQSQATGLHIQRELPKTMENDLIPKIEKLFDELGAEHTLYLDRLDLELGAQALNKFDSTFSEQILSRLEARLRELLKNKKQDSPKREAPVFSPLEQFFYFLETGQNPWWAQNSSPTEHKEEILIAFKSRDNKVWRRFRRLLKANLLSLDRLVYNFPDSVLNDLLHIYLAGIPKEFALLQKELQNIFLEFKLDNRIIRNIVWKSIFHHLSRRSPDFFSKSSNFALPEILRMAIALMSKNAEVKSAVKLKRISPTYRSIHQSLAEKSEDYPILSAAISEVSFRPPRAQPQVEKNIPELKPVRGWFVENAGLILLHPFLEYLFMELGWLRAKQFRSDQQRHQAVRLLQYLALGR